MGDVNPKECFSDFWWRVWCLSLVTAEGIDNSGFRRVSELGSKSWAKVMAFKIQDGGS